MAFGETHKIVGGHPSIGDWNVDAAPAMNWSDGDVWSLDVSVPSGTGLEFKAWHSSKRTHTHNAYLAKTMLHCTRCAPRGASFVLVGRMRSVSRCLAAGWNGRVAATAASRCKHHLLHAPPPAPCPSGTT